jgi:endoplasmic reticulum Man9GlcNAc2 1,2-alpha-mannosidase
MNIRDPFDLYRNSALDILKLTASRAAANIKDKAIEVGSNALDMSFSVPKNVPSFGNPNRNVEDHVWRAAGMTSRPSGRGAPGGILGDVQDRVGGFFDNKNTLPMYKDKPYSYAASRRIRPLWQRKRSILSFVVIFVVILYYFGAFSSENPQRLPASKWGWLGSQDLGKDKADWSKRRERVVEAFELSWDAYERYAWGKKPWSFMVMGVLSRLMTRATRSRRVPPGCEDWPSDGSKGPWLDNHRFS